MSVKWFVLHYECDVTKKRFIEKLSQLFIHSIHTGIGIIRYYRCRFNIQQIEIFEILLSIAASNNVDFVFNRSHTMSCSRLDLVLVLYFTLMPDLGQEVKDDEIIVTFGSST